MSSPMEPFLACHRFGFGPTAAGIPASASRETLEAQLARPDLALISTPLPSLTESLRRFYEVKSNQEQVNAAAAARRQAARAAAPAGGELGQEMETGQAGQSRAPSPGNVLLRPELVARIDKALTGEADFLERLVVFWANHFTISRAKGGVMLGTVGPFEREAIRPHVTGPFRDMLFAVMRHAGMLRYLDNGRSTGPNSLLGLRLRRGGVNENLAREILELHTVGVDAGYTQQDVTAFAFALSGWSNAGAGAEEPGRFVFRSPNHEPGPKTVMGKVYAQDGEAQAAAILDDLARHPATARHLARKLAMHFVADVPPPALVAKLEDSFRRSGGNLGELARVLLRAEESWTPALTKLRTPYEFVIGAIRSSGSRPNAPRVNGMLANLGQAVWRAPSPAGYSDRSTDWLAPDAIKTRVDFAIDFARTFTGDALALARHALGPALTDETQTAIMRAETSKQGLVIALMSPEFQRR